MALRKGGLPYLMAVLYLYSRSGVIPELRSAPPASSQLFIATFQLFLAGTACTNRIASTTRGFWRQHAESGMG